MSNPTHTTVVMIKAKDCRSCIKFDAAGNNSPVRNVYVNRPLAESLGNSFVLKLEPTPSN